MSLLRNCKFVPDHLRFFVFWSVNKSKTNWDIFSPKNILDILDNFIDNPILPTYGYCNISI